VQRVFSQTAARIQDSHHGGVHSQYDAAQNLIDLHIDAGANNEGKLMQDLLLALWEARDTLTAGEARAVPVPGHVFMRPAGARVLKMTMENLGEALGTDPSLTNARQLKRWRQARRAPLGTHIPQDRREDTIDSTIAPEHISYRNALVGAAGVTMSPIGAGTSGGYVDMLAAGAPGTPQHDERVAYDTAINLLTPFMSIAVEIDLTRVNEVISMLEERAEWWDLMLLRARYLVLG
jgi:hypothetical protein